jgi:hypothetical protein
MRSIRNRIAALAFVAFALAFLPAKAQYLQGYNTQPNGFPLALPAGVPSPVARYRMIETAGTVFTDAIGGFTGAYVGGPTLNVNPVVPSEPSGVQLVAMSAAHTAAGVPGMTNAAFTALVFFSPLATNTTSNRIECFGAPAATPFQGWCITEDTSAATTIALQIGTGSAVTKLQITNGYPAVGVPALAAVTYDGAGNWALYSYFNGALLSNTIGSLTLQVAATAYVSFGSTPPGVNYCQCVENDAMLFSSALTSGNVTAIAQAGLGHP